MNSNGNGVDSGDADGVVEKAIAILDRLVADADGILAFVDIVHVVDVYAVVMDVVLGERVVDSVLYHISACCSTAGDTRE